MSSAVSNVSRAVMKPFGAVGKSVADVTGVKELEPVVKYGLPVAIGVGAGSLLGSGGLAGGAAPTTITEGGMAYTLPYTPAAGVGGTGTSIIGGTGLGGMAETLAPYALGAGVIGSQYLGAQQQQQMAEEMYNRQQADIARAQQQQMENIGEAQKRATETWRESAFPEEELIESKKLQSTAEINRRAQLAQRAFMENMASRGITGGGQIAQGLSEIERDRQRQISEMASALTQFGATPYQAAPVLTGYPGMAYPQMQPYDTFGMRMADVGGALTGTMGGLYAYDWLRR